MKLHIDGAITKGGAIKKPRKKSPKRDEKIEEALQKKNEGGAIRKPRKKSPKKRDEKIEEAIQKKYEGGAIRKPKKYHSKHHKYLMEKLTGRGGRLDSPQCRNMMHHVFKNYPPEYFQTYIRGRVTDNTHYFHNDHMTNAPRPRYVDSKADVIDR